MRIRYLILSLIFLTPYIVKAQRDIKKDLAYLFDCKEENIGTELSDFTNYARIHHASND